MCWTEAFQFGSTGSAAHASDWCRRIKGAAAWEPEHRFLSIDWWLVQFSSTLLK